MAKNESQILQESLLDCHGNLLGNFMVGLTSIEKRIDKDGLDLLLSD